MSAIDSEPFPRGALIAMAGLIGVSLVATAAVRIEKLNTPAAPMAAAPPMAVAVLTFSDEPDGSIRVQSASSHAIVATIAPGTGGFVRGVMRGLARDRISRHIGAAPPFRVAEDRTGALTLQDTATGRTIDLDSFGDTNRAAFAAFLPASGAQARGGRS